MAGSDPVLKPALSEETKNRSVLGVHFTNPSRGRAALGGREEARGAAESTLAQITCDLLVSRRLKDRSSVTQRTESLSRKTIPRHTHINALTYLRLFRH